VILGAQATLLSLSRDHRREILRHLVQGAPTRQGGIPRVTWHIGNVEPIGDYAFFFRVGKTTRAKNSQFDVSTSSFSDQEFDTAPYSHALLHLSSGVCGISSNTRLAVRPDGVARQLQRLLTFSDLALDEGIEVEVSEISDPDELVQIISEAFRLRAFTFKFTRPNPFDADRDFHAPLSAMVAAANGREGKTTIEGDVDLDRSVVNAVARSAAATGDDLSIRVKESPDSRTITKRLRGNSVAFSGDIHSADARREAVERMMQEYAQVRGGTGIGTG
jgi:hypothetical protein